MIMTEAEMGEAWLAWERMQVEKGKRPLLPCDVIENRTKHESRLLSDELNADQIKILKLLEDHGSLSSVELGKKLNKKSISISLLTKKLIKHKKVRKVGLTDRSGPKNSGTAVWIYEATP